ncbi:MAG: hypothetical protein HZB39_07890, partial [Planctomycetes bacterium]|nr:hypothetical protein [Planctomycetota bacterium]
MSESSDASSAATAIRFLQQVLNDRAAGRTRTLAEYRALFPGHEQLVTAELAALDSERDEPAGDGGPLEFAASGGRYSSPTTIGRGGMGTILRVFDPALGREVAMKVLGLDDDETLPEPRALARFLDEARVTGRLQHPGVAAVFELGVDGNQRPYFTMPLIEGRNLESIVTA